VEIRIKVCPLTAEIIVFASGPLLGSKIIPFPLLSVPMCNFHSLEIRWEETTRWRVRPQSERHKDRTCAMKWTRSPTHTPRKSRDLRIKDNNFLRPTRLHKNNLCKCRFAFSPPQSRFECTFIYCLETTWEEDTNRSQLKTMGGVGGRDYKKNECHKKLRSLVWHKGRIFVIFVT